jgi:hypothetical protein
VSKLCSGTEKSLAYLTTKSYVEQTSSACEASGPYNGPEMIKSKNKNNVVELYAQISFGKKIRPIQRIL